MMYMFDTPFLQATSWVGLVVAAAPFVLLFVWLRNLLRSRPAKGIDRLQLLVMCLAMAVAMVAALASSYSSDLLYPPSIDEERNIAGTMAISRGWFIPFQGPEIGQHLDALRLAPMYLGPFYYLISAPFLLVSEGPASSALKAIFIQLLMIIAGSAFLRRTAGTVAVAVWCCLSVTFLAERSAILTHLYLGMPFAVLGLWALHESIRSRTADHVPLFFLAGALAMQFHSANAVWLAFGTALLIAAGVRASRRTLLLSAGSFLLVQSFSIVALAAELIQMMNTADGTARPLLAIAGLAAGLVLAIVISGIAGRLVIRRFPKAGAILQTTPGPIAMLLSGLIAVAGFIYLSDRWQERFGVFIVPAAMLIAAITAEMLMKKLRAATAFHRTWVGNALPAAAATACIAFMAAVPGIESIESIMEPDEFGNSFAERFDESEFGGPLVDFIRNGGVTDPDQYLRHTHSLVNLGNGYIPPVFPLFYKQRQDGNRLGKGRHSHDRATEFLFLPRAAPICGGDGSPPVGRPDILAARDYCVIKWPSRLARPDEPARFHFDRYTWPTQLIAGIKMPPAESAHKHDHGRPVPARLLPGDERTLVILAGEKPAFVRLDGIEVRPDEMFRLDGPTPTTISLMRMGPDGGSIEVAPNHDEANWLQPEIFDLPMTPGEIGKQLQSIGATRIQRKP